MIFSRLLLFRITYKEEGRHRTLYNKYIQAWKFLMKSAMSQCRGRRGFDFCIKKTGRRPGTLAYFAFINSRQAPTSS